MSFLLDALRKSEDQKRRGTVPTIHGGTESHSESRMPRAVMYAILVAVPLLLVLAWALLREPGESTLQEPVITSAEADRTSQAPAGDPKASSSARVQQPLPERTGTRPLAANRTPVETYQAPSSESTLNGGPKASRADAERRSGSNASSQETQRADHGLEPAANEGASQAPAGMNTEPASNSAPMPGLILFWELPASVRDQINEMHISVMVFAERPEDRFLLMNGARYVEGDEPQPGLKIEEITRDGVIFTFRRYRFLRSQ